MRQLFSLVAILFAAPGFAAESVSTEAVAVPDSVAKEIREKLTPSVIQYKRDGELIAQIWLRTETPTTAIKQQITNGLTYRELSSGCLIGVIQLKKAWSDGRKHNIPAGIYTLRYALQPVSDDHKDSAPGRDFCLLCPIANDTSLNDVEGKDLYELSRKASGGDHPAPLLLEPNPKAGDKPNLATKDGRVAVVVKLPVAGDGAKGHCPFAFVMTGFGKD